MRVRGWRFIFEYVAHGERLFSHCIYTKSETSDRLTPQLFEAVIFLKSNKEFYEYSKELILHAASMNKIETLSLAYKQMEEEEREGKSE